MIKKFKFNLEHTIAGAIWGTTFVVALCVLLIAILPGEDLLISKLEITATLLGFTAISSFVGTTMILFKKEVTLVNVTRVCPVARQHMSEQDIVKYEVVLEDNPS